MRVSVDDGRLPFLKSVRDRFGEEFELVERRDRLVLVPVPDDPLEALREEARNSETRAARLTQSALDEAFDESGR